MDSPLVIYMLYKSQGIVTRYEFQCGYFSNSDLVGNLCFRNFALARNISGVFAPESLMQNIGAIRSDFSCPNTHEHTYAERRVAEKCIAL